MFFTQARFDRHIIILQKPRFSDIYLWIILFSQNNNFSSGQLKQNIVVLLPPAHEICEGNFFTGVWLSTGGVSLSRGVFVQMMSLSGRPPHLTVTCGRCASYWNAFLFSSEITFLTLQRILVQEKIVLTGILWNWSVGSTVSKNLRLWEMF